jgi:hypothetical protein
MILGRSALWEEKEPNAVAVPLRVFSCDIISFTYSDSFYTFSDKTLHGTLIPSALHRGRVYRLDELTDAVREFGMPPGYTNPTEEFDAYIEAQIWDDRPLWRYVQALS